MRPSILLKFVGICTSAFRAEGEGSREDQKTGYCKEKKAYNPNDPLTESGKGKGRADHVL